MSRRRTTLCAVIPIAAAALGGCSNGADESAAARATHFYRSLDAGDAAAACADLATETRTALEEQEGDSCANVILDEDLPTPVDAGRARTYGTAAQVRVAGDTMFLSRYSSGWRVTAAGCTPAGTDRPYDCTIEVG